MNSHELGHAKAQSGLVAHMARFIWNYMQSMLARKAAVAAGAQGSRCLRSMLVGCAPGRDSAPFVSAVLMAPNVDSARGKDAAYDAPISRWKPAGAVL